MRQDYRDWLEAQGYVGHSISSRISNVRKVERDLGRTLDEVIAAGDLAGLIETMVYTKSDERKNRPNPSAMAINGNLFNGLQTLKSAVTLYAGFAGAVPEGQSVPADADADASTPAPTLAPSAGGAERRFSYEDDLQATLRGVLDQLEPGLMSMDNGRERQVFSGRIDILARDAAGVPVVIELKAGTADARVIGQVLGYMSDVAVEDEVPLVRGIIVAHDFDARTRSAARAVPNLRLVRYAVSFRFEPMGAQ